MVGENQVRNLFVNATSTNATTALIKAGVALNGAVVNQDGTAAAAGTGFMYSGLKSNGQLVTSDVINPNRVLYAHSVGNAPRELAISTISGITADANTLYQVRIIIQGYGSLSVENEYIKEAFYKSKTGDTAEDIVDGLVKSLARNFSREQPELMGQTFVYPAAGGNVNLPDNAFLKFSKSFSDGTAEQGTLTVTVGATEAGIAVVTLNGVDYDIPVDIGTTGESAADLAAGINALSGYSATAAGAVVTVVSEIPQAETDMTFSGGTATSLAATAATTVPGVDGTAANAQLHIEEKAEWLSQYYVTGKKTRLSFPFIVEAHFTTAPTVTTVKGSEGVATGYHVRNMEYYYKGNRADTFRGAGYPHNFEQSYDSDVSKTYFLVELGYWDESRDEPMKSKKQLTIACETEAAANTIIAQINTALTGTVFSIASL